MGKALSIAIAALISLQTAGCDDNSIRNMSPDQLHRQTERLQLDERYNLYLEVYKSRTPSNPLLAEDIVKLGPSARSYVLDRAIEGDVVDLQAALPVISSFGQQCLQGEERKLHQKAESLTNDQALQRALLAHVAVACRNKPPSGWQ